MASSPILFATFAVSLFAFACKPTTTEPAEGGNEPPPAEDGKEPPAEDDGDEPAEGTMCGGIAAIQCPAGQSCVDDPRDDCDPEGGGADCSGVCKKD